MIKINQLKLPVEHTEAELVEKIKRTLKLKEHTDFSYKILRRSLDARKKPQLFYVYTLGVETSKEESVVKRIHIPNVSVEKPRTYQLPMRPKQPDAK